ncbi:MAG: phosphoribosylglycinamide formyltransferase [Bryobacteraceae bacterium]|nr:phosphoribosylglycinamide formyltransferase [Bryobacteraceae bacterium]
MRRLGVLLSGRGSNLRAISDHIASGSLDAEIAVVISNRPDAPGLTLAAERGYPVMAIPSKGMEREAYDRLLAEELNRRGVELVILAGYMRLLSGWFIRQFPMRILNIHPSLLPAFPGLDAQHQAWEHGVKVAGCTVHFVDEGLDSGPIVMQSVVPVLDGDTAESLAERILREEHGTYSEAIGLVLSGRFRLDGRRVIGRET